MSLAVTVRLHGIHPALHVHQAMYAATPQGVQNVPDNRGSGALSQQHKDQNEHQFQPGRSQVSPPTLLAFAIVSITLAKITSIKGYDGAGKTKMGSHIGHLKPKWNCRAEET